MYVLLSCVCVFGAFFLASQSVGPLWDQFADRYLSDIKPKLTLLNIPDDQLHQWMRWWGFALVGSLLLFGVILTMPPIALFAVFIVFVAPRYVLDFMLDQRRITIRDQLVRATVGVANGCRAGLGLPQAIEKVAADTRSPLADELKRITRDYRAGRPLSEAIRDVQHRLDVEAFTTFASAVTVTLEKGGRIPDSLDRISRGLQEMQRLERKLEADSAAGKRLALILSLFPIAFIGMFYLLDPAAMSLLFGTLLGQLVIFAVLAIVYVSWLWCMNILDLDL